MKISVVIPIYGCRTAIEELYKRLVESVCTVSSDFEIIMVNDHCPQNSWEVIQNICSKDDRVKGIDLSRNFGQMKAILAGLDYSTGDWVVVMDCDLQDRPEEIPKLYQKVQEGYDVVFALRVQRQDNKLKILVSNIFYKIYSWAIDGKYDGQLCNFSIVNRKVVDQYCLMREEHRSYVMYLQWLGFKHSTIDVEHNERFEGKSSYNIKKRISMALEILTSQSDKILHLVVQFGLFMSFVSFIVIIGLIINKFTSNVATGWTSIVTTLCLIGGIIIAVIGMVGIYVGNIFMQVKGRPLYAISEILNESK